MDVELFIIEAVLALGFVVFGYQRWQMGHRAASIMCFVLASYFGRISLLYAGRIWENDAFSRLVDPQAIFTNAALLLAALVMAVIEAHDEGFQAWRERWKGRHRG